MYKSDSIKQLAEALSKAQKEIKGAIKDSTNPFFRASYADLSSVWDACREPLTKNGLSISQVGDMVDGTFVLETILAHSSGEWISGKMPINPTKNDPQGIGSALTYIRRYALAAIVGVCPEDDDANDASGHTKKPAGGSSKGQTEGFEPPNADSTPAPSTNGNLITEQQKKLIFAKCQAKGINIEHLKTLFGVKHIPELKKDQMKAVMDYIDNPV